MTDHHAGPLSGIRILEFAGLGPAPFAAMMLADQGAEVIRISRPAREAKADPSDVLARGRRSVRLDLKQPEAIAAVRRLIASSNGLIEGFRPGVMESLGLGPEACWQVNPELVFGRATGWGQSGPLALRAGHDINYIALSGALQISEEPDAPPPPSAGLVGDFGGGGMFMAFGMVCALLEARTSGKGQVVDAAVSDGAAVLTSLMQGWRGGGEWELGPRANVGNGAAPFFNSYRCADGRDVSIGPIEDKFYRLFLEAMGLGDDPDFVRQWDRSCWAAARARLGALFASRPRAVWCELLEGIDSCFAPILDLSEAPEHPHNRARQTFVEVDGVVQPAPAPRFSRSGSRAGLAVAADGADTVAVLKEIGLGEAEIAALV